MDDLSGRSENKAGKAKIFCAAAMIVWVVGLNAYGQESFPINIAVEFTDHAASAYISLDKGWFEDEGLKPSTYSYVTGMSLAAALGRGDIQAAYICLLPVINAYANAGAPIKIVSGTHKHGYGLVVDPKKVKTVKDLEDPGIRIGCVQAGGPADAILMKMIEEYGLDKDRVLNKIQRMNPAMQVMAIKMGKLDASFNPEHWPAMAEECGFKMLLTSRDVWPGMQGSVLVVKEGLINDHPEVVRKLVKITRKATAWINQNPEEAALAVARQMQITGGSILPPEVAEADGKMEITSEIMLRSMKRMEYATDIDPGIVRKMIDYAAGQGNIKRSFNVDDILDLRFLNEQKD
jgi:NitT/TauT family transport system substrate-binding protein